MKKLDYLMLALCACLCFEWGCSAEDERYGDTELIETGTVEQPLASRVTDNSFFGVTPWNTSWAWQDGCSVGGSCSLGDMSGVFNSSYWTDGLWPSLLSLGSILYGAPSQRSVTINKCATGASPTCNSLPASTGEYRDLVIGKHCQSAIAECPLYGSAANDDPYHITFYNGTPGKYKGALIQLMQPYLENKRAALGYPNTILGGRPVRIWAFCRGVGQALGLALTGSTNSCMGARPGTQAELNARSDWNGSEKSELLALFIANFGAPEQ